jgi:O-antigen/teichoic acid export membrane protein
VTALGRLLRRPVSGALAGQATHALSGLVLQVAAARELGAAGLAAFSLGYGALVLATAVCSGLVGDGLTILDRHETPIRAGLHVWTAVVCAVVGVAGVATALLSGIVPVWAGLVLGAACAAFIVEDTLRRLLMATGRFWSLPAVDLTSLGLALGTLIVAGLTGRITMTSFVVALVVAQSGAALVAWWCLPAAERPRGPWRRPALRVVASFGIWPAVTQTIRPAALTLLRILLIAAVGAAAYGPVEIARVYTAPTLLLVTGVGSFLLTHFVALRRRSLSVSLQSADRAVLVLTLGVAALGGCAVALLPWLGDALTGGEYPVPAPAVLAWTGYAVAAAALLPYSRLALVHGGQRRVLAVRTWELASLPVAALVAFGVDGGAAWAPLALALGPALAAVVLRQTMLVPLIRREEPAGVLEQARA